MLCFQHLLTGVNAALLITFFSLVNKRLCSPGLKHCLNVYSAVLHVHAGYVATLFLVGNTFMRHWAPYIELKKTYIVHLSLRSSHKINWSISLVFEGITCFKIVFYPDLTFTYLTHSVYSIHVKA